MTESEWLHLTVVRLYDDGVTVQRIANFLKIKAATVMWIIRQRRPKAPSEIKLYGNH